MLELLIYRGDSWSSKRDVPKSLRHGRGRAAHGSYTLRDLAFSVSRTSVCARSPSIHWAVIDGNVSGYRRGMNMHRPWLKLVSLCLAFAANLVATAQAEDSPARPVKIISDSAPGSAVDVPLRMVADRLGQIWGQQVLPVNQPGAGGTISARVAAEAAPDGYTLYMPALSVFLPAPG